MNLNHKNVKLYATHILICVVFLFVGAFTVLTFESMRYTKYVEPKILEIEPKKAYEIMSSQKPNEYLFFDVRSPEEYSNLHAVLAENVPIAKLFDMWRTLPRDSDKKIYLICTGGRLAGVAYGFLQLHGFRNIVHIRGGLQNWVDQGVPTVMKPVFPSK